MPTPKKNPFYCDYSCKYAAFSEKSLSGACNRETAVYCESFRKYNNRLTKCINEKVKKLNKRKN
jgi:hypothetical protein